MKLDKMKTALVIVDLQNNYFPNGDWELKGTEKAASNAAKLLNYARKKYACCAC